MIFIFEDFPMDALSVLFRYSLSTTVCEKFRYAKGAPKIAKVVTETLAASDDAICIFLDLVPGNSSITAIYRSLKAVCKEYANRAIVIPIVCMEYYFINVSSMKILMQKPRFQHK